MPARPYDQLKRRFLRWSGVSAALLSLSAPAAALPPPVPVRPVIVVSHEDSGLAERLQAVLASLSRNGFLDAGTGLAPTLWIPGRCMEEEACAERKILVPAEANQVLIFAHDPGMRAADHSVVCLGPDSSRTRRVSVNLRDAEGGPADAALSQRSKLASCLIGALHGSPATSNTNKP